MNTMTTPRAAASAGAPALTDQEVQAYLRTGLRNRWWPILPSRFVEAGGKPLGLTRLGEKLVPWRGAKGEIHVQTDRCPHRMQAALSHASPSERSPGYYGWRVLIGAVGLALSPGPVALLLFNGFAHNLVATHGWSFGAIMFNMTVLNLASIVAAPPAGYLIDRFGARAVMLPSIVIMAICLVLWGYAATTLPRFHAISALYGFATIGAQSVTYTKLLTGWFDKMRGMALGIPSAGLGLGYFVLPWIINFGLARFGASGVTLLIAALLVAFPLLINFFVAHPREAAAPTRTAAAAIDGASLSAAAATKPFWIMAAAIFLISIIATGIVPHFAIIARDAGFSRNEGALIASLFGFATLSGRLLVGWLFDLYFAPLIASAIFCLAAIGYGVAGVASAYGLGLPTFVFAVMLMGWASARRATSSAISAAAISAIAISARSTARCSQSSFSASRSGRSPMASRATRRGATTSSCGPPLRLAPWPAC